MRGFTLLEVLVSVSMVGIIMAGLYGAYTSNMETIQRARRGGEISQTARGILDLMSRDLEGVFVGNESGLVGEKKEIGGNSADQLQFETLTAMTSSTEQPSTDLKRVLYYVREAPDGEGLILYRSTEGLAGAGIPYGKETYELSRLLVALKITFVDREGAHHDEWSAMNDGGENEMPVLVRILLTLRSLDGGERTFVTAVHPELENVSGK